jgi:hypothetical protein
MSGFVFLFLFGPTPVGRRPCARGRQQPASVRIIAQDQLSRVASRHDLIDGIVEFGPRAHWHVRKSNVGQKHGQSQKQETKSVTAKPRGLGSIWFCLISVAVSMLKGGWQAS